MKGAIKPLLKNLILTFVYFEQYFSINTFNFLSALFSKQNAFLVSRTLNVI